MSGRDNRTCAPCKIGYYKAQGGPSECTACPINTYGISAGAAALNAGCNKCPLNSDTAGKSSVGPAENVCQCRRNYYRHGNGTAMECKQCPLYSDTAGKSSVGPAENVCQCRANYYRHGHGIAMECKPCPKNSRTNGARATSSMQCLCDVGRVRENDVCVECKEGTFMTTGASDIRVCKTCPPGTFQNIKGQKKCLPCPVDPTVKPRSYCYCAM